MFYNFLWTILFYNHIFFATTFHKSKRKHKMSSSSCCSSSSSSPSTQLLWLCPCAKEKPICKECVSTCHCDHHDIVHLGTKRNTICQCQSTTPKDTPIEDENFRGLFCRCHTEWDAQKEDLTEWAQETMHQCEVCTEWFHRKCMILGQGLEEEFFLQNDKKEEEEEVEDAYRVFLCRDCLLKYSWLANSIANKAPFCLSSSSSSPPQLNNVNDTFIPTALSDVVCQCPACMILYPKMAPWILDPLQSDNDDVEFDVDVAVDTVNEFIDAMTLPRIAQIMEKVLENNVVPRAGARSRRCKEGWVLCKFSKTC